jgi:hypothetical protein
MQLSELWQEVYREAVQFEEAAPREGLLEIRRGVFLAAKDLERIGLELERVGEAVLGFRRSCTVSELRRAKRHAAELRNASDERPRGRSLRRRDAAR